jgi:hypothetical protein
MFSSTRSSAGTTAACLATVVAFGALAAGCGASSGLSKSALDAKANAICGAEAKAGEAVPAPSNIQDATQAAAYFDKVEPIVSGATTKLEALKPGSSIKTDWNAYIALRKQETTLLQTVRQKADAKDPSGLADLDKEPDLAKKVDAAATKVGAATCAE